MLEKINGVKIITENCDKCKCKTCGQWKYILKKNDYISCPYSEKPCLTCKKLIYAAECLFFINES